MENVLLYLYEESRKRNLLTSVSYLRGFTFLLCLSTSNEKQNKSSFIFLKRQSRGFAFLSTASHKLLYWVWAHFTHSLIFRTLHSTAVRGKNKIRLVWGIQPNEDRLDSTVLYEVAPNRDWEPLKRSLDKSSQIVKGKKKKKKTFPSKIRCICSRMYSVICFI